MTDKPESIIPTLYDLANRVQHATGPSAHLLELLGSCWVGVHEYTANPDGSLLYYRVDFEGVNGSLPIKQSGDRIAVGCVLEFGYPVQTELMPNSEIEWFCIPDDFDLHDLVLFATGKLPFDRFHEMVNLTARHEMSKPLPRFPKSCLVMVLGAAKPLRKGIPQRPDPSYLLWTQSGDSVSFIELKQTDNPHSAADQARELGFNPTIYRCCSGQMVAFTNTPGGPFL